MRKIKTILAAATVMASVALAGSAPAAVNLTFTAGSSVASGATVLQDFNSPNLFVSTAGITSGILGFDYALYTGNVPGFGATPNNSGTQYLSVFGGHSVTYTLATAVQAIQFDWGTISTDNVLTVYTTDNTAGQTFSVSTNYNQNGLLIGSSAGGKITGLKFTAGSNSFELDNIAVATAAVPEPASWAMMVGGFGMLGFAMRRRRSAMVRFA